MAEAVEALATHLVAARQGSERIAALPPELVPASEAAAYAVQDAVLRRLGAAVAGWKVGAAGPAAAPNCAPLLDGLVLPSPARLDPQRFPLLGIEGELAFRLGRGLPPRARPYDEDEVWDALDTLHVAIELVDSRFADRPATPPLALLADNGSNGAFAYGPPVHDWRAVDFLRQPARLVIDGREVAHATGGNAAGHPRRLLAWLANHLASRRGGLEAGDIVTTGTHTGLLFAEPGAVVTAEFAALGAATLTLAAA
jgi:2-keto-4-pentenoate hydratase